MRGKGTSNGRLTTSWVALKERDAPRRDSPRPDPINGLELQVSSRHKFHEELSIADERRFGKFERMKTRIVVNKHIIRANEKGIIPLKPPISVQTYKETKQAFHVDITGPACLKYSPHKPLKCGATVWLETEHPVEIIL
jgi:hypothetical protein